MIVGKISKADGRRSHLTYWRKEQSTHPATRLRPPARPDTWKKDNLALVTLKVNDQPPRSLPPSLGCACYEYPLGLLNLRIPSRPLYYEICLSRRKNLYRHARDSKGRRGVNAHPSSRAVLLLHYILYHYDCSLFVRRAHPVYVNCSM